MDITIKALDPTGVAVKSESIKLPLVVEKIPENGYKTVVVDGIPLVYEPRNQYRYYLYIKDYVYRVHERTGELELIKKGED